MESPWCSLYLLLNTWLFKSSLKDNVYWFFERQTDTHTHTHTSLWGRDINWLSPVYTPTRNWTSYLTYVPWLGISNPQAFGVWDDTLTNWAIQPGHDVHLKCHIILHFNHTELDLKKENGPGWCGSMDWAPTCKPQGHLFDSQSEHIPGLQTKYQAGGAWEATTLWCFSPSIPPFPSV